MMIWICFGILELYYGGDMERGIDFITEWRYMSKSTASHDVGNILATEL